MADKPGDTGTPPPPEATRSCFPTESGVSNRTEWRLRAEECISFTPPRRGKRADERRERKDAVDIADEGGRARALPPFLLVWW